jgi:hypothetical protein
VVRGNGDKKRKKTRQSRTNVFERGLASQNFQAAPEEKIGSNWYPQMHDPKATSCKKDTNYPTYMKLDPKRWFFPEADDCCKSFYFWDSDCVQKSIASSRRWYPEFTGIGGCKDDDNAPQFMKADESYFVDTLETCCETYFVWNVKGCMEPVHPEPEPCPDNAEEDTAETEHDYYPDWYVLASYPRLVFILTSCPHNYNSFLFFTSGRVAGSASRTTERLQIFCLLGRKLFFPI